MEQTNAIVDRALKEITETLVREYRPEKIILFGSRASGTPRPDSDVDLCLLKTSDENPLDLIGKAYGVLWGVRRTTPVDLVVYTPQRFRERQRMNDPFVRRIVSQGKVLYDARRSG